MAMYIDADGAIFEETGDEKKEILGNITSRINKGGEPPTIMDSPPTLDQEKRMRREIANSNERRRMQSINNGFQSLRSLLPHHEGEKLSKAAILQQTAEYIYSLEQEKTRLLSQNCQLKRLVNQHEGGGGGGGELPPKKRMKQELILSADSADEGLGSMSPEPVKLITVTVNNNSNSTPTQTAADSPTELKMALDRERNMRLLLEDQVRQLEQQVFKQKQPSCGVVHKKLKKVVPLQPTHIQFITEEADDEITGLQLVSADCLPPVGQTVVCSAPPSRCSSPETMMMMTSNNVTITEEERLPSVLKAAIKAEPKVEVERLPSPNTNNNNNNNNNSHEDSGTIYSVSNTSRQNLETIVEAIRHLEGDHMFGDDSTVGASVTVTTSPSDPAQEIPLALTTPSSSSRSSSDSSLIEYTAATVQQHQQSRPGVIVVKQAS